MTDHPPRSTEKFVDVEVLPALGAIQQVLIGRRKLGSDSVRFDTEAVEHPLALRRRNEVASIEVRLNVSLKSCCLAQSQRRSHDAQDKADKQLNWRRAKSRADRQLAIRATRTLRAPSARAPASVPSRLLARLLG